MTAVVMSAQPRAFFHERFDRGAALIVFAASRKIETAEPGELLTLNLHGVSGINRYNDLLGIAWALKSVGYDPQILLPLGQTALGPAYHPAKSNVTVVVVWTYGRVTVLFHRTTPHGRM
jgi:hypothetical protein